MMKALTLATVAALGLAACKPVEKPADTSAPAATESVAPAAPAESTTAK